MATYLTRLARSAGLIVLFLIAAILGIATGVIFAYAGDLPQISALDDYAPSTITRVYGRAARSSASSRSSAARSSRTRRSRRSCGRRSSPPRTPSSSSTSASASRASSSRSIKDIIERRKAAGASTLTQQLARKLFLTDEKTWERKIKEALLAIQIEKRYTKREIFTLYCNQMYFGHGVYGVEAASRLYFGKSAKDLTLEEAALIAGILQGNVRQSPYVNMDAALRRRNYTLGRMAEVGFITAADAEDARKKPIVLRGEPSGQPSVAPYFLEEVRKELEARYGAKQLYENGLSIQTGARRAAPGSGEPRARRRPAPDRQAPRVPQAAPQRGRRRADDRDLPARALGAADGGRTNRARRRHRRGRRGDSSCAPARSTSRSIARDSRGRARRPPRSSSRPATSSKLGLLTVDEHGAHGDRHRSSSRRSSKGAVLAIDNRTGQIRAMIGGYSFERSKFNRATQAYRQVGSAFKPIVYTAAIDRGYTPATIIMDTPASFPGGAGSAGLHADELRPQVRGADHAAARARGVAQRAGGARDGAARARSR